MAVKHFQKVWPNGALIPWDEATIHVASHVVSYASCLFEGIRCYDTPQGPGIFRWTGSGLWSSSSPKAAILACWASPV